MDLQILKNTKPWNQILALALITLGVGIFVMLLGILIVSLFVDGNILSRLSEVALLQHPGDLSLMKYFQIISQIGFFVSPPLFFAFLVDKNIGRFFSIEKFPSMGIMLLSIVIMLIANPVNEWLVYHNNLMHLPDALSGIEQWMRDAEENAAEMTNILLDMHSWKDYMLNLFMIGILAALGEELLFRGVLQPILIKKFGNEHLAIWLTAFVFSFIHFQFYGFFARLFAGAVLGYLYFYTKNLWIPILAHFFNNAMAVSYVYFTNTPLYDINLEGIINEEPNSYYALISLLFIALGLYWLKRIAIPPFESSHTL